MTSAGEIGNARSLSGQRDPHPAAAGIRHRPRLDSRRLVAEAIGTFFLVFIGPGASMVNAATNGALTATGVALAFGLVVAAMIFAIGHLSGAHINPAVTIGFWSVKRFATTHVLPYIAAQVAGAVSASAALRYVLGPVGMMGATVPAYALGIGAEKAFVVEWVLSFALMFVIMAVATDDRVPTGLAAVAVGSTVGLCAMMGGPLTGASMNPARSLGPALIGGQWSAHWVYWLAPVTAMMVAAHVYEALRGIGASDLGSTRSEPRLETGVEGVIDPRRAAIEVS